MEGGQKTPSYQGHRVACDQCSQRKVRCTPAQGACQNCVAWGKTCQYSPKIPSGRPRKRPVNGSKDIPASGDGQQTVKSPSLVSSNCSKNPSVEELPQLTRSSTSLSSFDSQLVTPVTEALPPNLQSTDFLYTTFQNDYYDDSGIYDQEYFPNTTLDSQDAMDCSSFSDLAMVMPSAFTEMSPFFPIHDNATHLNSQNMSMPASHSISRSSLMPPRRDSSDSSAITFTALLNTVMSLRSKSDILKRCWQACLELGQPPLPDTGTAIDEIITSFSQYFDQIEPHLMIIHRRLSNPITENRGQEQKEIYGTIHIIVMGSSLVVDTAHTLYELLHYMCRNGSKTISTRLETVLRFSTIDFHVRRCIQSLGIVSDIVSADGSELLNADITPHELSTTKKSAEVLQEELATAIEALRRPIY